uniref:Uncharacterized protein n=1 Tax=viral metagenome TaxID=1070528 RepID=A0A6C0I8V7_9ZZZZ
MNIIILIGVILFFIVVVSFLPKNDTFTGTPKSTRVSNLKAKFTNVSGTPALDICYTTPESFGKDFKGKDVGYYRTILYIQDCGTTQCTPDTHPSVDTIIKNGKIPSPPFVRNGWFNGGHQVSVTNTPAVLQIPLDPSQYTFTPIPGNCYSIGVSIMNEQKSFTGTEDIPNVYGEFAYVSLQYPAN